MNDTMVKQLREKASAAGQGHIFRFWDELSRQGKVNLIQQVQSIDFTLLKQLKETYLSGAQNNLFQGELQPPEIIPIPATDQQKMKAAEAKKIGEALLSRGKVAALLVAGGQGSRLGFDGPKGMYTIAPISRKSLFQLHAEKIAALQSKYGAVIPWFIMTSETNHDETVAFFQRHRFFGLSEGDVYFFRQGMIPALDGQGSMFLDAKDHIFTNPNGHGGTLNALRDNGCLDEMKARGIEEIFYFQIDNVLIKICDPTFLGYHRENKAEMSAKLVSKRDPYEKVGVVGWLNGKLAVIEYSDLSVADKEARNSDGSLKFRGGSIAIHVFHVPFIENEISQAKLPYHLAFKKIPHLDEQGRLVEPAKPNGYKFEMFIFDALQDARAAVLMEVDRKKEFSPVKNKEGSDSAETARQDLVDYYADMLKQAGVAIPAGNGLIEIDARFALDAEDLKRKIDPGQINVEFPLYLQ
ncbi:MAG: UTP--glucose-1-phosphate uridylyltransferase [Candidatus Zhuqueibacterota bacterium]